MREKQFVSFRLPEDPIDYKLCYDVNVICDVEAETGVNIAVALFRGGLNFVELRALLFALLRTHFSGTPALTLEDAGDLLTRDWFLDDTPVQAAISRTVSGRKGPGTEVAKEVPLAEAPAQEPGGTGQSFPEILKAAQEKLASGAGVQ